MFVSWLKFFSSMFNSLFEWFYWSSANPDKIATTVKGICLLILPLLANYVGPVFGWNIDLGTWTAQVEIIREVIVMVLGSIGTLITAFGAIRKVYLTLSGKNA